MDGIYIQRCGPAGATPRGQVEGFHIRFGVVVSLIINSAPPASFDNDHRDRKRLNAEKSQKQGHWKSLGQVDARPG